MSAQSPPAPELLAERYRMGRQIGYGGMGRVYEAHDERLDRDVAVKLVDTDVGSEDEITREARASAKLAHPGIVRVFDAGSWSGGGFIVMELVPGQSLRDVLVARGALPPGEALEVSAAVADALDHAHSLGIVHCDVKPHNILITPEGRPKLVDFGIARALTVTATGTTGDIRGSACYLAPEQLDGSRPDARTDVYALGAVLYEMLTGQPPFAGRSLAEVVSQRLAAEPRPPSQLRPTLGPDIDKLVLRALARDPRDRFVSAALFRNALLAGSADAADLTRTVRISGRTVPPSPSPSSQAVPGAAKASPRGAPARPQSLARWNVRLITVFAGAALALVLLFVLLIGRGRLAATATVPELTGKRMSEAPVLLEQAHLRLGDVSTSATDAARSGTVISQQPPAGQQLPSGGKVQLVIGVLR